MTNTNNNNNNRALDFVRSALNLSFEAYVEYDYDNEFAPLSEFYDTTLDFENSDIKITAFNSDGATINITSNDPNELQSVITALTNKYNGVLKWDNEGRGALTNEFCVGQYNCDALCEELKQDGIDYISCEICAQNSVTILSDTIAEITFKFTINNIEIH